MVHGGPAPREARGTCRSPAEGENTPAAVPVPGALVAGGQRRPGGGASRVFSIIRPAVTHHRAFRNFSNLSFSLFIGKTLAGIVRVLGLM